MIIAGDAMTGSDAVALALETEPDVVIMDVIMPRFDGIEATKRISQVLPNARIVVFTGDSRPELINLAFSAGAVGYVAKPAIDELLKAIRKVAEGRYFLSPRPSS